MQLHFVVNQTLIKLPVRVNLLQVENSQPPDSDKSPLVKCTSPATGATAQPPPFRRAGGKRPLFPRSPQEGARLPSVPQLPHSSSTTF